MAKNVSDADAEATFLAMMNGIDPSRLDDEMAPLAVWLIDGYEPTPAAVGVFAAANMNATPYPMLPYQGLLHTALGAEIVDFMQGKESSQALADVEAAYTAAAREKGFLAKHHVDRKGYGPSCHPWNSYRGVTSDETQFLFLVHLANGNSDAVVHCPADCLGADPIGAYPA